MGKFKSFFDELKRRNIYKVGAIYAITAFVVVQIAQLLIPAMVLPEWFYRLVVAVAILGLPLALVIAWAFEITPEGVRPTSKGEEHKQINERSFWFATGIITIILLGGWWYLKMESPTNTKSVISQDITNRSIAVLPLKSVSGSDEPLPLAEGLHDDLLTRLANVGDLKVISRTSVEKFRGTELTLPAIAGSLGVKWIVEGNVQKSSNKVEINAKLIDPATDTPNWAETYQRDMTAKDIFAVQGDIAREIASALQVQLSLSEQERITGAPTQNLEAYRLYVKGRKQLAKRTYIDNEHQLKAVDFFQQAIEIDSTFALAWSGIADAAAIYPLADSKVFANLPWDQETAARRALELNPKLAEAQTSMGFVHLRNLNAPAALNKLQYAIELKPSYWQAHFLLGELYFHIGRSEQALNHLKLATELNPNHARARHWLYDAYNSNGQHLKALQEARRQQKLGLENVAAIMGEVRVLYRLDRLDDAQQLAARQFEKLEDTQTVPGKWLQAYLVQILSTRGDTTRAQIYLNKLKSINAEPPFLGWAYLGIGMIDKAMETYQKIEGAGWGNIGVLDRLRYYGVENPSIKENPRYRDLIQEANRAWGLNPDGSFPKKSHNK